MAARSRGRSSRPRQATANDEVSTTRRRSDFVTGLRRARRLRGFLGGIAGVEAGSAAPDRRGGAPPAPRPRRRPDGPYSPLGSITQARRPKTAWRQRYDFTKELFPLPICPNTTMLGLVTTPCR